MSPRLCAAPRRPAAAALILLVPVLTACVSQDRPADCDAATTTMEVTVSAEAMTPNDPAACVGQAVTLVVRSEVDGVFHAHGLDDVLPATTLTKGEELVLEFAADRTGQFPIELHPADDPRGMNIGIVTIHGR